MDDIVHHECRFGIGGRAGRLETSALIDRDIDDDRSALHQPEHIARDEPRRTRSGHEHRADHDRSEEHTSELQSLMRISYAVFCLKKKKKTQTTSPTYAKLHPTAAT